MHFPQAKYLSCELQNSVEETKTELYSLWDKHYNHQPTEPLSLFFCLVSSWMECGTASSRQCQGPATAEFLILGKKGFWPHTGSLSYGLCYRASRDKEDTSLVDTYIFAFPKNADKQLKVIYFRSSETILFNLDFCVFVWVLTPKTLLFLSQ